LERSSGNGKRVLVLPTASAPEGDGVFDRWAGLGMSHYGRMGVEAEVLPLKTEEDANSLDLVRRLDDASMVFFSGGNPAYLSRVLNRSAFWLALLDAMDRGLAYGGCSAGISCLGEIAPDSAIRDFGSNDFLQTGLGLFPKTHLGPHWNALDAFAPGLKDLIESMVPSDSRLLAVDERTAVVGDGTEWNVLGSGGAHLLEKGAWRTFSGGESFAAALIDG